jgi:hypothetical protein
MSKSTNLWLVVTALLAAMLFSGAAGDVYTQLLVANDDTYGVPFGQFLDVEEFGVLDNNSLDEENAGEAGATVTLVSSVSHGTPACVGTLLELCENGAFNYTPDTSFTGLYSFTYEPAFDTGIITRQTTVTLTTCTGGPTIFSCWKESAYLAELGELGYSTFQENIENEAVWDSLRAPYTASRVIITGIRWETNHPDPPASSELKTGSGPSGTGGWEVYDPDHGYAIGTPAECDVDISPSQCLFKDGFTGTREASESTLYGVDGYFTGSLGPKLL